MKVISRIPILGTFTNPCPITQLILWTWSFNWRNEVSTGNGWNLSFLMIKCREATGNLKEPKQDKSGTKMPHTMVLSPEIEQMESLKLPFQCIRSMFQTFQTNPVIVPRRFIFLNYCHIDFFLRSNRCFLLMKTVIHHLMLTFNHSRNGQNGCPLWCLSEKYPCTQSAIEKLMVHSIPSGNDSHSYWKLPLK